MRDNGQINNIPKIIPKDFIELIKYEYADKTPTQVKPIMIWGAPGIGKSDSIKLLAKELSAIHNKKYVVHDIRLSLYNQTDLKGIPYPNYEKQETQWLKPDIFNMDTSDDVGNILFFDELTNATPSVASATYQLILDRNIAGHKIPDNCYIICAGNRLSDKCGTYKMPTPLANRLSHFEFEISFREWKNWALGQDGLNHKILSFLEFRPDLLFSYDTTNYQVAFATPRSWETVGRIKELDKMLPLVQATVGVDVAEEFYYFCKIYNRLPNINDIERGLQTIEVPARPDILYALTGSLVERILAISSTDTHGVNNLFAFTFKMPKEFQTIVLRDLLISSLDKNDIYIKLLKNDDFTRWLNVNQDLLGEVKYV